MPFIPQGSDFAFDSGAVALRHIRGVPAPAPAIVSLMSDVGGLPGSTLETFNVTSRPFSWTGGMVEFTSVSHPVLQQGTQYWLVVQAVNETAQAMSWELNTIGDSGTIGFRNGSTDFEWSTQTSPRSAYQLSGTPLPEPAALASVVLCFVVIARRFHYGTQEKDSWA